MLPSGTLHKCHTRANPMPRTSKIMMQTVEGYLVWYTFFNCIGVWSYIRQPYLCNLLFQPVHPSIFFYFSGVKLWRQQLEQGSPDLALPSYFIQLLWGREGVGGLMMFPDKPANTGPYFHAECKCNGAY